MISQTTIAKIREMIAAGNSQSGTARACYVSTTAVRHHTKDLRTARRHTQYTTQQRLAVLEAYRLTGSARRAGIINNIPIRQAQKWVRADKAENDSQ